jgi:acetyltransferase-like isoleucine patch superfamily enzyme
VPANVLLEEGSYVSTTLCFKQYRSRAGVGLRMGVGASCYDGTMFDVGVAGEVTVGRYAMLNAVWITAEHRVEIGDNALISWNVIILDSYRFSQDPVSRVAELEFISSRSERSPPSGGASPVTICDNVWIGFDCCILPGVNIGEGSVIGAKSVVRGDIPAGVVAAGNPARVIRPSKVALTARWYTTSAPSTAAARPWASRTSTSRNSRSPESM